jgi:ferrous-iron efflux pump FieF
MHEFGNEARLVALRVSVVALLLALAKAVVGVLSGSLAVLASAIDSAGDALASAVNFVFLTVASKPPDEDHPFGHGKAENLAAMFEGVLILSGSIYLIYEAIRRFGTPQSIELSLSSFIVMGISIFASVGISSYLKKNATREDSTALAADAVHYSSDVIANGATLVSMLVARFYDIPLLDSVFGVVVGIYLGTTALRLIWNAGHDLMDHALPEEEINRIVVAIEKTDDAVLGFDNLRTRRAAGVRFIDFELWIDREVTFEEAHDVTERIKRRIREVFPDAIIAVHSEPVGKHCLLEERHQS